MLLGAKSLWSLDRIDASFRGYEDATQQAMTTDELRRDVLAFVGAAREYVARDTDERLQATLGLYDETQTSLAAAIEHGNGRYGDAVKATRRSVSRLLRSREQSAAWSKRSK